jgi:uncharacterized membrane protein
MIWILMAIYILIIIIEVPGLLKKQQYKELTAFMVLFVIALYMGLAFFFQWPLSAPFETLSTYMGRS